MVAAVNRNKWWRDYQELSELKVTRKVAQLTSEVQPDEKPTPNRNSDRDLVRDYDRGGDAQCF